MLSAIAGVELNVVRCTLFGFSLVMRAWNRISLSSMYDSGMAVALDVLLSRLTNMESSLSPQNRSESFCAVGRVLGADKENSRHASIIASYSSSADKDCCRITHDRCVATSFAALLLIITQYRSPSDDIQNIAYFSPVPPRSP